MENINFIPVQTTSIIDKWDDVEVHPVWDDGEGNCDVCDKGQETYWSVYLHLVEGGVICIADLPNEKLANDFAAVIEGAVKNYVNNEYLDKK